MFGESAQSEEHSRPTRAELLREKLTQEIISGRLVPGAKLDEQEIANRFDVSRTPVREAVRHLVAVGLAESQPHVGATVSGFHLERLSVFLDAATELEVVCVRLAASRMDSFERANLASLHASMRKELLGSAERYVELDRKFHECIYQGSQNEVLADAIRKLQIRLWPIYRVRLTLLQNARQSYSEHDQIVSAIGAGDVIASQLAMRAHMSSSALMLERLHGNALGVMTLAKQERISKLEVRP